MKNKDTLGPELRALCMDAKRVNEENLRKILSDNAKTRYGEKMGFSDIHDVETYRKNVPICDYDDMESYIKSMLKRGKNILTTYPIAGFCQTSGTTDASKYIPLSEEALSRYSDYFERYKRELHHEIGGKRFLINCFRADTDAPSYISLFSEIYFPYMYQNGWMDMADFVGGKDMIFSIGEEDILYAKMWEFFATEDITILECQFMYELLIFFGYMEDNWKSLLHDMKEKSVPDHIKLSDHIKHYLKGIDVSKERFEQIEQECSKGFDDILKRLWGQTELISGVASRGSLTEESALKRYVGDVSRYYLCYCASECYIGTPAGIDDYGYVLLPQNGFFEFLPVDADEAKGDTLLPHELKKGELYEPVITNFSGLYRYRMKDILQVTGFIGENPVMEFATRKSQALNVAEEKYDTQQLEKAVFSLRSDGIYVKNYCVGGSLAILPGRYIAAFVLKGSNDIEKWSEEEISGLFDKALCEYNSDYKDLRNLKQLRSCKVLLFTGTEFNIFSEMIGLSRNHGHNKPKHIYKGEASEELWKKIRKNIRA